MASSEYSFSIYFEKEDFTFSGFHKRKEAVSLPLLFSGFETASLWCVLAGDLFLLSHNQVRDDGKRYK